MMMGASEVSAIFFVILSMGGALGIPLGMPPAPEDPLLSSIAPEEPFYYITWNGCTTPDPSLSPTEAWMGQPELKAFTNKLIPTVKDLAVGQSRPEDRELVQLIGNLVEQIVFNAGTIFISEIEVVDQAPQLKGGAVFHLGENARDLFESLKRVHQEIAAQQGIELRPLTLDGIDGYAVTIENAVAPLEVSCGLFREEYLMLALGDQQMQQMLADAETPPPSWLNDLKTRLSVDRVSMVTWIDFRMLWGLKSQLEDDDDTPWRIMAILGLDQMKTAGAVCGLDEQGFIGRTELRLDGEPRGLWSLIDGKPLDLEDLQRVPEDSFLMAASRLSWSKAWDLYEQLAEINGREMREPLEAIEEFNEAADIDLRADMVEQLDEMAYVHGKLSFSNPAAFVLAIGAKQTMALRGGYDSIMEFAKDYFEESESEELVSKEVKGVNLYTVSSIYNSRGPSPNWALSDEELLFSLDTKALRRHLRKGSRVDKPLVQADWFQAVLAAAELEGRRPIAVTSFDLKQLIQLGIPMLTLVGDDAIPADVDFSMADIPSLDVLTHGMVPCVSALYRTDDGFELIQRQTLPGGSSLATIGIGIGVTLPAVHAVRQAARRTNSLNNLRQLGLAANDFYFTHKAFPASCSTDENGKPLLSWRVHLLPYLDELELYEQFHLDEPWDSEHNKTLIEKMPRVFDNLQLNLEPGQTVYLAPIGSGSVIQEKPEDGSIETPAGVATVPDGDANTILFVEANRDQAVEWTRPADYHWEEQANVVDGLQGNWNEDVRLIIMADGAARAISTRDDEIWKRLLDGTDGEPIDWYEIE